MPPIGGVYYIKYAPLMWSYYIYVGQIYLIERSLCEWKKL